MKLFRLFTVAVLVGVASGCAGGRGKSVELGEGLGAPGETTAEESRLRAIVAEEIAAQRGIDAESNAVLRQYRPFVFREYYEFPDGERFGLNLIEQDSRTTPLAAQAEVRKIRYATDLHKNRDAAREDTEFYRDTGREIISYEWRSGDWKRWGSLFVAETTELEAGGEWQSAYRPSGTSLPDPMQSQSRIGRVLDVLQFWK
jgi:hypothetical protein